MTWMTSSAPTRSRLVPKVAIAEYVNLLIRESEGASYDKAS